VRLCAPCTGEPHSIAWDRPSPLLFRPSCPTSEGLVIQAGLGSWQRVKVAHAGHYAVQVTAKGRRMKRIILPMLLASLLLAACVGCTSTFDTETTGQAAIATTPTTQPANTPVPTRTSTATETLEPTDRPAPTPTDTPTPTAAPVPSFTLSGVVFFDHNGNGAQDGDEPVVPDAVIEVGILTVTTGLDGRYALQDIPEGDQYVRLSAPGFRYIALSLEAFQSTDQPVLLAIDEDMQRDWGLMQGFLTLPIQAGISFDIMNLVDVGDVYDHTYMQDWMGGSKTYPGHQGIDFNISNHAVVAAAPGIVIGAEDDYPTNPDLEEIGARVVVWYANGFHAQYNDMKTIAVDYLQFDQDAFRRDPVGYVDSLSSPQQVSRGQVIGYTGFLGAPLDDVLHFENWTTDPSHTQGESTRLIDPYKLSVEGGGVFANRLFSLWTRVNDPHCPP
jgi:hypothetical protein